VGEQVDGAKGRLMLGLAVALQRTVAGRVARERMQARRDAGVVGQGDGYRLFLVGNSERRLASKATTVASGRA
jgi:hypothetical protein